MIRKSVSLVLFMAIAALTCFTGTATAKKSSTYEIPANLEPPTGAFMIFELNARGVQIYTCEAKPDDAAAFVWTFKAPEADLFNSRDELVGHHFAGPTWQGLDSSAVVGKMLQKDDSPDAGSIPWLLLEAKEHTGTGPFATVTYVQRLATSGGIAPAKGCDETHAGDEVREPYEATYAFFYTSGSAKLNGATAAL